MFDMTKTQVDSLSNLLALTDLLSDAKKLDKVLKQIKKALDDNNKALSDLSEGRSLKQWEADIEKDNKKLLDSIAKRESDLDKKTEDLKNKKAEFEAMMDSINGKAKDRESQAAQALEEAESRLANSISIENEAIISKTRIADREKELDALIADYEEKKAKIRQLNSEL